MGKNKTLIQNLCLPYCAYYKPGKNEELLCRGAELVDRLMQAGRSVEPEKAGAKPGEETIALIVGTMCIGCAFHDHDCDFMEDRQARPCGGFVLLSELVTSGQITIDELTHHASKTAQHR
jgi:hypothetical protein